MTQGYYSQFLKSIMRKLLFSVVMFSALHAQAQARYDDPVPQKNAIWLPESIESVVFVDQRQSLLKIIKSGSEVCVVVQKLNLPSHFACGYEVMAVDTTEQCNIGLLHEGSLAFSLDPWKGSFIE